MQENFSYFFVLPINDQENFFVLAILDSLAHPRSSWEDPNLKFYYSLYDESFFLKIVGTEC